MNDEVAAAGHSAPNWHEQPHSYITKDAQWPALTGRRPAAQWLLFHTKAVVRRAVAAVCQGGTESRRLAAEAEKALPAVT
jgi:hypothetical protein